MNRRTSRRAALTALAALSTAPAPGQQPAPRQQHETLGLKHDMPAQPEEIAMLVYPGMTALDLIGPQQVFGYMMATRVHLVWKSKDPIVTDTGVTITPSMTFASCPELLDILFVPGGGRETVALMEDQAVLDFLAHRGRTAKLVTSVCSGSLVLGAAGLLKGYKATSHWSVHDVLPLLGATPVKARVVEDRNRITAGGITSGIDFGLRIAARLRGDDFARALELTLEYDPQPPFGTGTPAKAGGKITAAMTRMYQPLNDAARAAARRRVKL
jgi:cyclohexyl-isocyanide hydratase